MSGNFPQSEVPFDLVLRSRRTVTEGGVVPATVCVRDGLIAAIGEYSWRPAAKEERDLGDWAILPGAVDPHVHFKEPGPRSHREDWESGSRQAAAGGVTTVVEMPLSVPLTVDKPGFDAKLVVAGRKSLVDFALWGGMNRFAEGHYREMHELGCVAFKVFMSTDPDSPRLGDYHLLEAFKEVAALGAVVGIHAENCEIIDSMAEAMAKAGRADAIAHLESRPDVAEVEAVQRALLFAGETGIKLHICHLSSAKTADVMRWYRGRGVDLTVETCPTYLTLDDTVFARCGAHAKCNPPIRNRANQERLWEMLFAGEINCLGSDHSPYLDEDRDKNLWDVPPGLSGIDLMLPVMLDEGVNKRGLGLDRLAELVSTNSAKRFGLYPRKGVIRPGADADFAVIDTGAEWRWSWRHSLGKSQAKLTPYEGREFKGKVMAAYVRGRSVYDGAANRVTQEPGYGRFIRPEWPK